jgi:CheY-like chemotaxis protein
MKKIRTLLVDDEQTLLHSLSFTLRRCGHEVTTAFDGLTAKSLLETAHAQNRPFDLLITDIQLPGIDGAEIIDECKRIAAPTAVVAITAYGTAGLVKRLEGKGVRNILFKPFTTDDLIKNVNEALNKKNGKVFF